MAGRALRWLEGLCLGTPLAVALAGGWAWQSGLEVDWRSEALQVALALPVLALLWWAARAATLAQTARAVTWAGVCLVGQTLLAGGMTLLEPSRPPVPALMLGLSGSVGTLLALLPGIGLLALGAVLREVDGLMQDEELTV